MKICMLTSGHQIFDNRIYYKEILSLKKKYDEIYIIAPGEKDFTTEDNIKVKVFPKRKSWYNRFEPMKKIYDLAMEINADVYHAHEPDSFQVAVKLKKKLNCKIIYDSHEYHPEGFAEHFSVGRGLIEKLLYSYEKSIGKKADYIISVNQILVDKFKAYNKNVALIPNYPVLDLSLEKTLCPDSTNFIYVGGLREDRGILKVLEGIKLVKNNNCSYYFIGPFETEALEDKVKTYVSQNLSDKKIVFTGRIPHIEVYDYLKKADVGFVLLQPSNWRYINSEPVKIFEYMMSGTAVLASDFPMMRKIVDKYKCGQVIDPEDPEKIAMCIEELAKDRELVKRYGENGAKAVELEYNWGICERKLFQLYDELDK
ncbi:hypothetical protein SAMN02745248_02118 [Hathewaya proteolytica DSM 3090]|uniref:Uncharacterized protein n=1 Tax=Hathewaya proteolytica DSM 3090 TaxID=1121331 RepID=A0A1M6QTL9_9CLOT|nr:glycosyltransferase family 4 protein [Hathewaya proteolytica]SHK23546.1 hypothetical protein SAMN02745248_02118 [Hathewaya proteolytica DSM 3090]